MITNTGSSTFKIGLVARMVAQVCNPSIWEAEVGGSWARGSLGTDRNPVPSQQAHTFAPWPFAFLLKMPPVCFFYSFEESCLLLQREWFRFCYHTISWLHTVIPVVVPCLFILHRKFFIIIHLILKIILNFQKSCKKEHREFPINSTWIPCIFFSPILPLSLFWDSVSCSWGWIQTCYES